jgi:glycosyltransferase involved in cell wall biosynthesis
MNTPKREPAGYDAELLLVLPVCFGQDERGLLFELQACNGIERWLENFSTIRLICPVVAADEMRALHSTVWKPIAEIVGAERVQFLPLPFVTSPLGYWWVAGRSRAVIREAIGGSRYLSFALGGQTFGDWGAAACLEAQELRRPYSVWTDAVQHRLCMASAVGSDPLRRLKAWFRCRMLYRAAWRCISGASLGLFHGASCYAAYAPWCKNSYVVHNVNAKPGDAISSEELEAKCAASLSDDRLRIIYAGRADAIKGPLDWIAAMAQLRERGVKFQATWLGDGPLLAEMRDEIARHGLGEWVLLPGFISDRDHLFAQLRAAHVLVFCHTTPESPRNLVEALICGCPIVGYRSDFAEELVGEIGGGMFVPVGDVDGLVEKLVRLSSDRAGLVSLIRSAASSGKRFNDVAVFRHRSELIKSHL